MFVSACFVPANWLLVEARGCDLPAFPLSCSVCLHSLVNEEGTYSIFVCTCIPLSRKESINLDSRERLKAKVRKNKYQEGF